MADTTNSIDIVLQDKVDAGIATKIVQIADSADKASTSVGSLKAQLAGIESSGLTGLAQMLKSIEDGTLTLTMSANGLAQSQVNAASSAGALTTAYRQQSQAAIALREAKAATRAETVAAALADKEASAQAKAALAEEASMRQVRVDGFLQAVAAADLQVLAEQRLQAEWVKEQIITDRQIASASELARARELASLKTDIIQRSPASMANDQGVAAQRAEITAATEAEALAEQDLRIERATSAAQGSQMSMLEEQMGNIRREEIILLDSQTVASERLSVAQEALATTEGSVASAATRSSGAMRQNAVSEAEAAGAARGLVSANVSAAAAMGMLEGRTLSTNRAAANFITKILGLGPILQQAFVFIGALALLAVLYQMIEAVTKLYDAAKNAGNAIAEAFRSITDPLRKTNDDLEMTIDKLTQVNDKLEKKYDPNTGMKLVLDSLLKGSDDLGKSLDADLKKFQELAKAKDNRVTTIGGLISDSAPTQDTTNQIGGILAEIARQQQDVQARIAEARSNLSDPNIDKTAKERGFSSTAEYKKATQDSAAEEVKNSNVQLTQFRTAALKQLNDALDASQKKQGDYNFAMREGSFGLMNLMNGTRDYSAVIALQTGAINTLNEQQRNQNLLGDQDVQVKRHQRDEAAKALNDNKAAEIQWKKLEAAYVHYQTVMDNSGQKASPQEKLGFLQSAGSNMHLMHQNVPKLSALELAQRNAIADQEKWKNNESSKLTGEISNIGLYSDALKEAALMNKLLAAAKEKDIVLTLAEKNAYSDQIGTIIESKNYMLQLASIYSLVHEPAAKYEATLFAIAKLKADGVLSDEQAVQGIHKTKDAYEEATSAVTKYKNDMEDQNSNSFKNFGTTSQIKTKDSLASFDTQLRKSNVDSQHPFGYSDTEIAKVNAELSPLIAAQQKKNDLDQESNKLLNAQNNLLEKNAMSEQAAAIAVKAGALSQEAANSQKVHNAGALNDQQLSTGTEKNPYNVFTGALQDFVKGVTTFAAGLKQSISGVFSTIANGVADTVGRAIAYGEDWGKAWKELARSAIGEMISSLIKLGLQLLVINTLQKLLHLAPGPTDTTKQTAMNAAASIAAIGAVSLAQYAAMSMLSGPAWSLAEAVSLSSFGANAAGAIAGMASVQAVGAAAPKLDVGTNYVPRDMLANIHEGEAVVPKAYNPFATPQGQSSNTGRTPAPMAVEVHNYAGVQIDTQHVSENRIRIIAKQAVFQHSDAAGANAINNPNSATSKSMRANTNLQRRRAN